jgi:hypothetical protein
VGDCRFYPMDDDLSEDWLDSWIATGLADVETYLGKYADFDAFLDAQD